MTAIGKIEEAEYFLSHFEDTPIEKLNFEVSAFTSAARSIFDHMLEDYRVIFDLGDIDRLSVRTFRERAIKRHNDRALAFLKWYEDEVSKLRSNRDYGFLFRKRDHNIHRDASKELHMIEWKSPINFQTRPGTTVVIPLVKPKTMGSYSELIATVSRNGETTNFPIQAKDEVFFEENLRSNIQTVCSTFFTEAKKMVEEARRTWGLPSETPKSASYYAYHSH